MINKKGQNIVEYAVLVALVVGAAVAMQTYVKRSLQAKIHDAADAEITNTAIDGVTLSFTNKQYEPYYAEKNVAQTSSKDLTDTLGANGTVETDGNEGSTIAGTETTLAPQEE